MSRAARDPRLTTPDTRSRLNTAAQQIISNAPSIRHELSEPSEARFDELDKKNSTIAALQRNFEGLSNMCKEERLKANEWKRQCEDQSKATDICKKKIADLEGKLRHLQDALDKGQGEKQGLLKVIEEQNKMKAELTAMKTSLQKKTQENIDKERALDQLRIELDKVNQCCAMLQSESGKLKTTINDAAMRYLNLENELNSSEIAKVELAAQLEKVGIDLNNALQTLSEYDSLSANSSKQLEMLKSELHASEEDRKEAAKRFFSLNSEYLAAVKEIQTLKEQILNEESSFKRKFESEINEKSALSDNLAKISKENRVFRAKIVEIEGEKHSLEVDIAEMRSILENKEKEGKEGVESIAQKLKIQSELVREYMKKIEITEKSLEKCKIQLSKSMAEREEAIKRENLIHSQLENSQNELKTALLESISLKSHSEILENKLKTELIAAERHFKTRETEYLESIRSKSQENKDLMGQLSAITASNQNLMGLLEAKNTENDEKDEKLRKFSEEIQHLTANISRLEAANSDMSEIHKLLNEISAQNSELESLRSSLSSAKQEICSLKLSSQSSDSLISRLHEVELSLSASEKESKLHARSVESLTSKLEVANSELTSTKAALNTLTIDFSQMRTANRQLDERLKSSEGSLRDARESIQRLQNQFESERSTTTALRGQTSELAERLHTAQTQIDAFQRTASRQEIMKSITEISHAIFAMESNLVCNACLEVMTDPVVCVPCGHNYCRTCKDGYEPACQQCGGTAAVKYTMKNQVVNEIASKVTFAKQVLEAVQRSLG